MRTVRLPASRLYFYITLFRVCTSAHLDGGSPFRRLSIFNFTVSREIRYSLYSLTISFIPRITRSFGRSSALSISARISILPRSSSKRYEDRREEERSSRYSILVSFFGSRRSNTGEISGEAEGGKSGCPQVVISMNKPLRSLLSRSKKKNGRAIATSSASSPWSIDETGTVSAPGRRAAGKETSERAKRRRTRASSRDSEGPIDERAIDDELNDSRFTADRKLDPTLSNADH